MNIGIIGSGSVGSALRELFEAAGHDVVMGSRSPADERATVSVAEAAGRAGVVVLAIPFNAAADLLPAIAQTLRGKVVIDPTNPLNPDWSPRRLGQDDSAGESIQRLLPGARVVKAFNTVFADVMTGDRLSRDGQRATAFIAGNDEGANEEAAALAHSAGFAAVKVGPLSSSRYLEAMAHLNIGIAVGRKGGTNAAFVYHQAASNAA
jgi:8-hydroxy-5-deazaflavin:NADPH oxidoreductase